MTCTACTAFAANPLSGAYAAGCRACAVRSLARSAGFHASMVQRTFRPDYRAALQAAAGAAWPDLHREVREWEAEHGVRA